MSTPNWRRVAKRHLQQQEHRERMMSYQAGTTTDGRAYTFGDLMHGRVRLVYNLETSETECRRSKSLEGFCRNAANTAKFSTPKKGCLTTNASQC